MTVAFKDWVKACQQRVEKAAENNLPQEALIPQKLHSAMRYSVIGGGKRVRPLLVMPSDKYLMPIPKTWTLRP